MIDAGHRLEGLVFTDLRLLHTEIYYYKTGFGREFDFIVPQHGAQLMLVQVCESLLHPQMRREETASLIETMAEIRMRRATIVTRSEQELIELGGVRIDVVSVWRFLLDVDTAGD